LRWPVRHTIWRIRGPRWPWTKRLVTLGGLLRVNHTGPVIVGAMPVPPYVLVLLLPMLNEGRVVGRKPSVDRVGGCMSPPFLPAMAISRLSSVRVERYAPSPFPRAGDTQIRGCSIVHGAVTAVSERRGRSVWICQNPRSLCVWCHLRISNRHAAVFSVLEIVAHPVRHGVLGLSLTVVRRAEQCVLPGDQTGVYVFLETTGRQASFYVAVIGSQLQSCKTDAAYGTCYNTGSTNHTPRRCHRFSRQSGRASHEGGFDQPELIVRRGCRVSPFKASVVQENCV
jgi:hypothetical protein